jgi:hypothetical protein
MSRKGMTPACASAGPVAAPPAKKGLEDQIFEPFLFISSHCLKRPSQV